MQDLIGTDGPLTRSRRKVLASCGPLTPGNSTKSAVGTPTLDAARRELFGDRTNQPETGHSEDTSPVQGWVKHADEEKCGLDVPKTPHLDVHAEQSMCSPSAGNGPTPNNTPAVGVPKGQPELALISQAVNELNGGESPVTVHHASPSKVVQQWAASGTAGSAATPDSAAQADTDGSMSPEVHVAELLHSLDDMAQNGTTPCSESDESMSCMATAATRSATPSGQVASSTILGLTPVLSAAQHASPTLASASHLSVSADPSSTGATRATPASCVANASPAQDVASPMNAAIICEGLLDQSPGMLPASDQGEDDLEIIASHYSSTPSTIAVSESPSTMCALFGTPAPDATRGARIDTESDTPTLQANGREDELPTPAFVCDRTMVKHVSPETPEDVALRPFSFSMSSGSAFATPEVPINPGITMTASEVRHAQKHIPAWNRVSKVVAKQAPLVSKQVSGLWALPTGQPTWAKTPFMLLQAICSAKGWELSMRHESEARIGAATSVATTVNIPDGNGGKSFTGMGKNLGQLEAIIIAAANTMEQLLKEHMVSGKDATAAVDHATAAVQAKAVAATVGTTPHPGSVPGRIAFGRVSASAKPMPRSLRPPVPKARALNLPEAIQQTAAPASTPTTADPVSVTSSPHTGIGVLAPTGYCAPSPELVLMASPSLSARSTTPRVKTPVYHPPMRTGTSSSSNPLKATIAAKAKPTGMKAVKEMTRDIQRSMKTDAASLVALTQRMQSMGVGASSGKQAVRLRGIPTPKGKHIRFDDDGTAEECAEDCAESSPEDAAVSSEHGE